MRVHASKGQVLHEMKSFEDTSFQDVEGSKVNSHVLETQTR